MARKKRLRLSGRARTSVTRFRESQHRRDAGGKFADKPGAGDDAPKRPAGESSRAAYARAAGRVGDAPAPPRVAAVTQVRGELTAAEQGGVRAYAGGGGGISINKALRAGVPLTGELSGRPLQDAVSGLDAAIAKSTLTQDVTLYRGLDDDTIFRDLKPGAVLVDRGFVSTTKSPGHARGFAMGVRPAIMEISAPKGATALEPTHNSWEQEVIFPRGSRLRYEGRGEGGEYRFTMEPHSVNLASPKVPVMPRRGAITQDEIGALNTWEQDLTFVDEVRSVDLGQSAPTPEYETFMRAVEKLPTFEGRVYRGLRADLDVKQGQEITFSAMSSTSTKVGTTGHFMDQQFDPDEGAFVPYTGPKTRLSILTRTGRRIGDLASVPEHDEVLIPKGTRFRVRRVFKATRTHPKEIELEELF